MTSAVHHHHSQACNPSHSHGCHHDAKPGVLMSVVEKITAVCLGIFSAMTNLDLFVKFFFAGVATGIYSHITDEGNSHSMHPVSSCSNGFLEQITGVKLPVPMSLAANIAVTVCHIDHHAIVFVPLVALSVGAWVGKAVSKIIRS